MPNPTVAEYVIARLADLGIAHVFGLPGDFSFPFDDAIEASDKLSWIVSSNELNAAYSADGYARIYGAAILTSTYAVGELSALNGVMGAKAERLPVFHLVGAPSMRLARSRKSIHHSFGDGESGQFRQLSEMTACASTFLTPENTISEMERVISAALAQRQPAYITVPQDYALMPVVGKPIHGVPLPKVPTFSSDPRELATALKTIGARLSKAKFPVILPAFTISRYGLQKEVGRLLAATGIPFATTGMDKGVISESHPLYLGMYVGDASTPAVRKIVERADLVLNLGGVLFTDFSTGLFSDHLQCSRIVTVWPDHVEVGASSDETASQSRTFGPVHMKDVLAGLTKQASRHKTPSFPRPKPIPASGAPGAQVTNASVNSRIQQFLAPGDIVVVETGIASFTLSAVLLPNRAVYHNQALWGSIGWATPAAFGAALADPSRRVVLVTGDGSHQLTATEIGVMGRYGVKPILLVLNNGTFGIEEFLERNKNCDYNKLAPWQYQMIPEVMGCRDWFCTSVLTNAELASALQKAREHPGAAYIEVLLGPKLIAPTSSAKLAAGYQSKPTKA